MPGVAELRERAECGQPHAQLIRGQQIQRAPCRPELDERPIRPQGGPDSVAAEAVGAGPQAELGRGGHLGVQAAEVADDADEFGRRGPFDKAMLRHPPRHGLPPGQAVGCVAGSSIAHRRDRMRTR
jgi:hypothetical protein